MGNSTGSETTQNEWKERSNMMINMFSLLSPPSAIVFLNASLWFIEFMCNMFN